MWGTPRRSGPIGAATQIIRRPGSAARCNCEGGDATAAKEKPRRVRAGHGDILTNSYVLTFVAFAIDEMGSPPGKGRADGVYRKPRRRLAASPRRALNVALTQRNVGHVVTEVCDARQTFCGGSVTAVCPSGGESSQGELGSRKTPPVRQWRGFPAIQMHWGHHEVALDHGPLSALGQGACAGGTKRKAPPVRAGLGGWL